MNCKAVEISFIRIVTIVAVGCAILALLSIGEKALYLAYRHEDIGWGGITIARFVDWYSCGLFVPFFYWLARRIPLEPATWTKAAPHWVAACLAAATLKIILFAAVGNQFRPGAFPVADLLAEDLLSRAIAFLAIAGLVHAHLFYLRGMAAERTAGVPPPSGHAPMPFVERFTVRDGNAFRLIAAERIERIDAQGNYARLHVEGRRHLVRDTMAALEARLDPGRFLRIHRSLIVNIEQIRSVEPRSHGEYVLTLGSGERVRSSRTYNERLRQLVR